MSQRTIVEFNHDYTHLVVEDHVGFIAALHELLRQGCNCRPDNERGEVLRRRLAIYGVTVSPTHHHSDEAKVTLSAGGKEYWRQRF